MGWEPLAVSQSRSERDRSRPDDTAGVELEERDWYTMRWEPMAGAAAGRGTSGGQLLVSGAARVMRSSRVRCVTIAATSFLEPQGAAGAESVSAQGGVPATAAASGSRRELKREQQLHRATEGAGRRATN